jgi:hypothetical protein
MKVSQTEAVTPLNKAPSRVFPEGLLLMFAALAERRINDAKSNTVDLLDRLVFCGTSLNSNFAPRLVNI